MYLCDHIDIYHICIHVSMTLPITLCVRWGGERVGEHSSPYNNPITWSFFILIG